MKNSLITRSVSFFKFLLIPLMTFTFSASAAPIWVRNGGGTSEFYLASAPAEVQQLLLICEADPDCADGIRPELQALKSTPALASPLQFLTSQELGEQVVKTKAPAGSDILINLDKLWKTGRYQDKEALDLADAISLLTPAWLEQVRSSARNRALVASKLSQLVQTKSVRTYLTVGGIRNFSLVRFGFKKSTLILEDSSVSPQAQSVKINWDQLNCEEVSGAKESLQQVEVLGARWGAYYSRAGRYYVLVVGELGYECSAETYKARFRVLVPLTESDRVLRFDPDDIEISQDQIEKF
jgi:hypothetical protein